MPVSKSAILLSLLGVVAVLGGCFVPVGEALIAKDKADFPFSKITVHRTSDPKHPETLVRGSDGYTFVDETKNDFRSVFLFKTIGDNTYVSQQVLTPAISGISGKIIIYSIIKRNGNDLQTLYCGNYSDATLGKLGVELLKGDPIGEAIHGKVCKIKSLDQLVALSKLKPDGERKVRTVKIDALEP